MKRFALNLMYYAMGVTIALIFVPSDWRLQVVAIAFPCVIAIELYLHIKKNKTTVVYSPGSEDQDYFEIVASVVRRATGEAEAKVYLLLAYDGQSVINERVAEMWHEGAFVAYGDLTDLNPEFSALREVGCLFITHSTGARGLNQVITHDLFDLWSGPEVLGLRPFPDVTLETALSAWPDHKLIL